MSSSNSVITKSNENSTSATIKLASGLCLNLNLQITTTNDPPATENKDSSSASNVAAATSESSDSALTSPQVQKQDEKELLQFDNSAIVMLASVNDEQPAVRVYCDGIYDLFHIGHMKSLEQAKKLFPKVHLIVGVCGDKVTLEKKGKTVLTQEERYESVRHCKWVDEVIEDAPWVIDQEFLDLHKIDYVAHDDIPYEGGNGVPDVYQFVKEAGKFKATQRTPGISTSEIITRILKNRTEYIKRNLKRGVTPEELNLPAGSEVENSMRSPASSQTFVLRELGKRIKATITEGELEVSNNWNETRSEFLQALNTSNGGDKRESWISSILPGSSKKAKQ